VALAKASLEPIRPKGDPIVFLFNPTQYSLDASNQIAEIGVPGLRAPVLQFVRGGARTLSLDLLLDAYEQRELGGRTIDDVTDLADSVYALLTPTAETGAPPICMFGWKDRRLQCIVERVSGRFTVFRADGAPLRATLSVGLREYVDAAVVVRRDAAVPGGAGSTRVVQRGDTLSAIAQQVYGDMNRWREIASANGISNPRKLQPGTVLVIPPAGGGGR
jgi:Contractile injection system tube protein/LysM domain